MRKAFNYSKLKGRIIEKYGSQSRFAEAVPCSEQTITAKLNGRFGFSQEDIILWSELLEIEASDIGVYFFAYELSKS